jgi:hypothetical protein
MENRKTETQFRGGRLRLAHEGNEALPIETDIIKYDNNTAVMSGPFVPGAPVALKA